MKDRDISLDIIRIFACTLVVLMHAPMPNEDANGIFLASLSYFTAPCIGLFFMVSGALLLPIKQDYTLFIKRRFSKIVGPTLFWSLIYIVLNIYKSPTNFNGIKVLASIPFTAQGHSVLWFMYTLSGLYLLAPILSAWVDKARKIDLQIVLTLWTISLCYPILDFLGISINNSSTGILYYFSGYVGYFLLGYYLKRYPQSLSVLGAAILGIIGATLVWVMKRYNITFNFYGMFWYLSIFIAALCVSIWMAIRNLGQLYSSFSTSVQQYVSTIANLSFGIYLSHILIMRKWLWGIDWINSISNYYLQTFTITIITLLFSGVLCIVLSHLPFAQWIIGYKYTSK